MDKLVLMKKQVAADQMHQRVNNAHNYNISIVNTLTLETAIGGDQRNHSTRPPNKTVTCVTGMTLVIVSSILIAVLSLESSYLV